MVRLDWLVEMVMEMREQLKSVMLTCGVSSVRLDGMIMMLKSSVDLWDLTHRVSDDGLLLLLNAENIDFVSSIFAL